MRSSSSYKPRETSQGLEGEILRLEAQAELSWRHELRLVRLLSNHKNPKILEVGCGPGHVTRRLRAAFPESPITAIDHDSDLIAHAQRTGLDNTEFLLADIAASHLPKNTYDLVISRFIYQHFSDPLNMAKQSLDLMRSGGLHVIIDIDDALWGNLCRCGTYPRIRTAVKTAAQSMGDTL